MYLSMQFTFFQPKHFSLVIREGGSDFNEDIDIDEEKGERCFEFLLITTLMAQASSMILTW